MKRPECDVPSLPDDLPAWGVFHPPQPQPSAERMLRTQGYRNIDAVRPAIRTAAENCANRAVELIAPSIHYRRASIQRMDGDKIILSQGGTFSCVAFPKVLGGAAEIIAFVLTLGQALDTAAIELMDRYDLLEALFLETAGWLCIEQTTKSFVGALHRWARPSGFRLSSRMGPGYAYQVGGREVRWRLEDQVPLFSLFDSERLPVRLLDSCAMLPKMSRSGLFGVSPLDTRAKSGYNI
jgi:hypothetical protein